MFYIYSGDVAVYVKTILAVLESGRRIQFTD